MAQRPQNLQDGLDVRWVHDQLELYRMLRRPSLRPRVVVLEDGPPQSSFWDGIKMVSAIKGDPKIERVPIVLISTNSGARFGRDRTGPALSAGADRFLVIPLISIDLETAIRELLLAQQV